MNPRTQDQQPDVRRCLEAFRHDALCILDRRIILEGGHHIPPEAVAENVLSALGLDGRDRELRARWAPAVTEALAALGRGVEPKGGDVA